MAPRFLLLVALLFFVSSQGRCQGDPQDPLGSAFRLSNQAKIRSKLPPQTCAVILSGGFQAFDAEHQYPANFVCDPDFYFLTGFRIPDAAVVVFSEPRTSQEGQISALLFLPDKNEYGVASMGYDYRGKFGLMGEGVAIRPASQWRKYCLEVLASESVQRVYTKPCRWADYRKPGEREFDPVGARLFESLAPGFAFEAQAQRFYREILAADSSSFAPLASRIGAWMEYALPEQEDPFLKRFLTVRDAKGLSSLQAEIRRVKIDLLEAERWLLEARGVKSEKEITLVRKATNIAADALRAVAARLRPEASEAFLQSIAALVTASEGGTLAIPVMVAAGKHSALSNFAAHNGVIPTNGVAVVDVACGSNGYQARITRTFPTNGAFEADLRSLYDGIANIHQRSLAACVPDGNPGKLQQTAALGFEALDKRLIFNTNALGARKVLKVSNVYSLGLQVEEGQGLGEFVPDMVLCVETALYLPDEDGVGMKWRGTGIVLRDVVRVKADGNEVLSAGLPFDGSSVEALTKAIFKLPEN